jgi:phosphate uptake regulator
MTIQLPKSVEDNLRFLSVEVDAQLKSLQDYFATPTTAISRRILDRSGYAYNLRMRIHSSCISKMANAKKREVERLALRSAEFVATDMERITELVRECVKQLGYVNNPRCIELDLFDPMLNRIRKGVALVNDAIADNDTQMALKIGQTENKLNQDYKQLHQYYISALKTGKDTEDFTQVLFVAQNIRQMDDALLHISESIISANLGQPVNFERYFSLQSLVEKFEADDDAVKIKPIAETRSGSTISGVSSAGANDSEYFAIFKDGVKRKVKEEREGVQSWHEIYPGLAPKILSYKKSGQSAALLIEHLPGFTFEQILLNEHRDMLNEALLHLTKTLKSVWNETRMEQPVFADFMGQIDKRINDVCTIHTEFKRDESQLCGLSIPSYKELMSQARVIEKQYKAPFSVYIHGDFNVDNIIYDPIEKRINFIDLHRSRYMDYVQDVSVFMVSNYRLQIMDPPLRRRILEVALDFYRIAQRFARKVGDEFFEIRLALGLARSFITSTRFILDKSLARGMFFRSRYLLEKVVALENGGGKKANRIKRFKVPVKEIFVD